MVIPMFSDRLASKALRESCATVEAVKRQLLGEVQGIDIRDS